MCRAFESHQACQKTAPQSTVFDCGACFFVVSLARRTHRCVSNRIRRATSERVTLVPIFYAIKISHPLHCSSFSQKSAARQGCSLVLYSSALPSLTTFLRSPALHHSKPIRLRCLFFVVSLARRTHQDRICNLPAEML